MAELDISIGGRTFEVACQDGEQPFLEAAAELLDAEAQTLAAEIGRLPESRMLLMAGLMLADKMAGLNEEVAALRAKAESQEEEMAALRAKSEAAPERVEVQTIPEGLVEMTARAESLAAAMEEAGKQLRHGEPS